MREWMKIAICALPQRRRYCCCCCCLRRRGFGMINFYLLDERQICPMTEWEMKEGVLLDELEADVDDDGTMRKHQDRLVSFPLIYLWDSFCSFSTNQRRFLNSRQANDDQLEVRRWNRPPPFASSFRNGSSTSMMMLKMCPLLRLSPWRRRRHLLSQTPPSSNRESRRDSSSSTPRCCTMKWTVA